MRTMLMALALLGATGVATAKGPEGKPVGRWERKMGKNHVRLVVDDGRIHMQFTGERIATIHADYSLTRDRTLYGIVTSVECEDEDADSLETELVDQPFSCRFRVDEGTLTIRDLKFGTLDRRDSANWGGRFRQVAPAQTDGGAVAPISYPLGWEIGAVLGAGLRNAR